uniref:BLOC-1 related complex subunit 6 n=1 Tax=Anser cygnoides TaxID=8845 RepID=A0A8B9DX29_ANSCY
GGAVGAAARRTWRGSEGSSQQRPCVVTPPGHAPFRPPANRRAGTPRAARLSGGHSQSPRAGRRSGPASANRKRHKQSRPRPLPQAAQSARTQTRGAPQSPSPEPAVRGEGAGPAAALASSAGQWRGKRTPGGHAPEGPGANRRRHKQAAAARPRGGGGALPARHAGSRSLEALSLAAGGTGAAAAAAAAAGRPQPPPEGRRATLASALELEGTVLREGRLTQFVANNLERRIRLSGAPRGEQPGPGPGPGAGAGASSIPAIDPGALQDVVALAGQVAAQVDELLRAVHCGLQALTALSVGCIQTYRDGVESLGEAADLSIRAMYALVARCEELDRAMQPVPALAKRIRDMKGTLERLEGLCK